MCPRIVPDCFYDDIRNDIDHQNVIIYDPHLFEYVTEFYRIIPDRCLDEIRRSRRYATRDAAEECKHWRSVIGMGTLPP